MHWATTTTQIINQGVKKVKRYLLILLAENGKHVKFCVNSWKGM